MSDQDLTVRFRGETSNLEAAVSKAQQAIARFMPEATDRARSSLDRLQASLDQNTAAIQASTSGWKSWLATAADATIVLRGLYDTLSDLTTGMAEAAR